MPDIPCVDAEIALTATLPPQLLGRKPRLGPEPERPETVIVAILTDGLENASRHYTPPELRKIQSIIAEQRETLLKVWNEYFTQ